jgi:ferrous iron transport protein A
MLSYPMKTKSRVNDTEVFLADLNPGEEATISGIDTNTHGQDRIRELGLIDGTILRVIKYAPLGDPMEIKIRGYYLSIRKSVARQIRVRRGFRGGKIET